MLLVLIIFSSGVYATDLNGVCLGTNQHAALANSKMLQEFPSTDKYRFEGGDVYHQYEGREEYLYNKVSVSPFNPNHFLSRHMRFILNNKQSG